MAKSKTADEMHGHVLALCSQRDIVVTWCRRISQAHALNTCEEICIPPIKSAGSYAVALHEIGHVLGRHQGSAHLLVRERWAWQWARKNAMAWTPAMETQARRSLSWYEARARERACSGEKSGLGSKLGPAPRPLPKCSRLRYR